MQNDNRNSNSSMSDRLYGEHYPDSFLDMPRPIWKSSMANMADNAEHLREICNQSNKCGKSCISNQSCQSHPCIANAHITCNCTDYSGCSELGSDPDNLADKINCIGNPYPQRNSKVEHEDNTPCVVVGAIF